MPIQVGHELRKGFLKQYRQVTVDQIFEAYSQENLTYACFTHASSNEKLEQTIICKYL